MTGTITGLYKLPGGGLAKGTIRLEIANVADQLVRDAAGNVIWQGPQTIKLRDGAFTLTVPASDGETSPTNLAYRITEELDHVDRAHHRSVVLQVADGATVDMADIAGEIEATPVLTQPVTELEFQARALPAGGTDGQVLAKASGDDYDTEWVNQTGGGGGGGAVDSVNGQTGTVVLDAEDVGAAAADHTHTAAAITGGVLATARLGSGTADDTTYLRGDGTWATPPSGGGGGSVTSDDITDATATGKAVLTAASSAAARTAIGAGTSSLALGTTSGTAKAGDYEPGWDDVTGKPAVIAAGADQATARAAIGAGTSDLALGTTSSTAKAGDWKPTLADIPAGSLITVYWDGSDWIYAGGAITARPTSRTDITIDLIDPIGDAEPPVWAIAGDLFDQMVA